MKSTIRKFATIEVESELTAKRQVRCVISAGGVDRQGDIVVQSGIKFRSFLMAGATILWQHDLFQPIARCVSIGLEDGRLVAMAQFPSAGVSAKADEIYGLIRAGVVNATSIGFEPVQWEAIDPKAPHLGRRYTEIELMEFSFVSVPAMPDATVIARAHRRAAGAPSGDGADHLAALARSIANATGCADKAVAAHARTRELLDQMGGLLAEGYNHAQALGLAGGDAGADEDNPDVELAFSPPRAATRESRLVAVAEAERRALGHGFLDTGPDVTARERADEVERLRRAGWLN